MNFREILKSELYALSSLSEDSLWPEFVGILRGGGILEKRGGTIILSLRHKDFALIKKCIALTKKFYPEIPYTLTEQQKRGLNPGIIYALNLEMRGEKILTDLGFRSITPLQKLLEKKGSFFLRGLFESRGYIAEPTKGYHLEISLTSEELANNVLQYLERKNIYFRLRYFKGEFRIYTKNAQHVEVFLGYIGASQSYLLLEKIRIEKLTLDELTGWVNCATSNLERVVECSLRQRQKINRLTLESLPPKLRQVAYLRLRHPYASLREIGELCNPPLSKVEVFRTLKKLENRGG